MTAKTTGPLRVTKAMVSWFRTHRIIAEPPRVEQGQTEANLSERDMKSHYSGLLLYQVLKAYFAELEIDEEALEAAADAKPSVSPTAREAVPAKNIHLGKIRKFVSAIPGVATQQTLDGVAAGRHSSLSRLFYTLFANADQTLTLFPTATVTALFSEQFGIPKDSAELLLSSDQLLRGLYMGGRRSVAVLAYNLGFEAARPLVDLSASIDTDLGHVWGELSGRKEAVALEARQAGKDAVVSLAVHCCLALSFGPSSLGAGAAKLLTKALYILQSEKGGSGTIRTWLFGGPRALSGLALLTPLLDLPHTRKNLAPFVRSFGTIRCIYQILSFSLTDTPFANALAILPKAAASKKALDSALALSADEIPLFQNVLRITSSTMCSESGASAAQRGAALAFFLRLTCLFRDRWNGIAPLFVRACTEFLWGACHRSDLEMCKSAVFSLFSLNRFLLERESEHALPAWLALSALLPTSAASKCASARTTLDVLSYVATACSLLLLEFPGLPCDHFVSFLVEHAHAHPPGPVALVEGPFLASLVLLAFTRARSYGRVRVSFGPTKKLVELLFSAAMHGPVADAGAQAPSLHEDATFWRHYDSPQSSLVQVRFVQNDPLIFATVLAKAAEQNTRNGPALVSALLHSISKKLLDNLASCFAPGGRPPARVSEATLALARTLSVLQFFEDSPEDLLACEERRVLPRLVHRALTAVLDDPPAPDLHAVLTATPIVAIGRDASASALRQSRCHSPSKLAAARKSSRGTPSELRSNGTSSNGSLKSPSCAMVERAYFEYERALAAGLRARRSGCSLQRAKKNAALLVARRKKRDKAAEMITLLFPRIERSTAAAPLLGPDELRQAQKLTFAQTKCLETLAHIDMRSAALARIDRNEARYELSVLKARRTRKVRMLCEIEERLSVFPILPSNPLVDFEF
eukprot:gnl/Chilomastix_cuspidata/3474.p1 GENE.gnl/Chilomastix_cuspidata/3474~~gnl/Chilomastix_cuspidata/3474.p1  ORF type:complete len:925 (-),score=248.56 gnl/Chilomastix_cuspidata/3474:135-2909(-)